MPVEIACQYSSSTGLYGSAIRRKARDEVLASLEVGPGFDHNAAGNSQKSQFQTVYTSHPASIARLARASFRRNRLHLPLLAAKCALQVEGTRSGPKHKLSQSLPRLQYGFSSHQLLSQDDYCFSISGCKLGNVISIA